MSKQVANEILKAHGLQFVKMSTGSCMDNEKCYTNEFGKRVKGIYCAGIGPLTVTNAHQEKVSSVSQKVNNILSGRFLKVDGVYIVEETARSITTLRLQLQKFPAYTRSADLDPSYKNLYLVPHFEKTTKWSSTCQS